MPSSTSSLDLRDWVLLADDGTQAPAVVPGTVAQVFADPDADLRTWRFRTMLEADPPESRVELVLEGIATSYEVLLDGVLIATGRSMFETHRLDVTGNWHRGSVLEIRCLPLATARPEGKPPRARWRTRLVEDNDLRLVRTTLLGRAPGIAPGPPVVGPWRPVRLQWGAGLRLLRVRPRVDGTDGVVDLTLDAPGPVTATCGGISTVLDATGGQLRVPDIELWWPHTHGTPTLYALTLSSGDEKLVTRVGFRTVTTAGDLERDGLDLHVNGVPLWARGAVWTPPGLLAGLPEPPRRSVQLARDAGMNLLRVPGTSPYEDDAFFDACDELGVLVWHDLALANLDVPHDLLREPLLDEVDALLDRAGGRPSLAVVCGGSETAQQVAMLGLPPDLWRSPFLDEDVPARVAGLAIWVPNSPWGGDLPMRAQHGVAHWFGVGGYRRPLSDARLAAVRFASECLAMANVGDHLPVQPDDPSWSDGVPRDTGSPWSHEDVREHYRALLHGEVSSDRWLEVSRAVSGEVMDAVLGEWRRAGSGNRGALVLSLRDLHPGTGWGLLDSAGRPKAVWSHLRRTLAPQGIWFVDEGLDGLDLHAANDRPGRWTGELRLALYRADDLKLEEVVLPFSVDGHGAWSAGLEQLLGRFVDASYAYRFGAPSHAAVVATIEDGTDCPRQAFAFPAGRPTLRVPLEALAVARDGSSLLLRSERLLDGVRVRCDSVPSDDAFCLEPGRARRVTGVHGAVTVTALNLDGAITL